MEVLVILWVLFALPFYFWGVSVAEYRGRSPWLGAVLGVLFGILGVGMVWMLPPNVEVLWSRRRKWEIDHGITDSREP